YPRWLRDPTTEQLAALAAADAEKYCPYVPKQTLEEAVLLLPRNPRAVRQFVRLLALLRPQIERHLDRELHWAILLAANVAKIRFPQAAAELLADEAFWHAACESSFHNKGGQDDTREKVIAEKLEICAKSKT